MPQSFCYVVVNALWRVHIDSRGAGAMATHTRVTCHGLVAAGHHRQNLTYLSFGSSPLHRFLELFRELGAGNTVDM